MPSSTAAARTKTLKVEPGCRLAWATRLNWFPVEPGVTAVVATRERLLRRVERIEVGRRLRQPGEQRGLRERQLGGRLGEVGLGGRLDPVGVIAVVDLVLVGVEDLLLRPALAQLDRETGLL